MNKLLWAFVAWTLFVWFTRLRNVFGDDGLTTGETLWAAGIAFAFLIIAASIPLVAFGARRFLPHYVSAIAVITIGWWTVRLFTNLAADESTGFKVVHTILSIVAIGLSAAILARTTSTMRQRAPSLPDTPETDSVGSI